MGCVVYVRKPMSTCTCIVQSSQGLLILQEFQREELDKAVKFVARNPTVPRIVFSSLQAQSSTAEVVW